MVFQKLDVNRAAERSRIDEFSLCAHHLMQGVAPSGVHSAPEAAQPPGAVRVTTALTYYLYLPVVFTPPPAISGQAIQHGAPRVGAQVTLLSGSTLNMRPVAITTTVTGEDGYYRFYDIRSTISQADEKFRAVIYGELEWYTPLITYTSATNYEFAQVDTTGLELISPPAGATITLPHTFSWTFRPAFPTDSYEVVVFEMFPYGTGTGPLGYVTSTLVTSSIFYGGIQVSTGVGLSTSTALMESASHLGELCISRRATS